MYLYIMMWDSIEEKRERWQKIKKIKIFTHFHEL